MRALRDLDNSSNNNNGYNSVRMGTSDDNNQNNNGFLNMVKHCFPGITWKSVSFFIMISLLLIYIIDLIIYYSIENKEVLVKLSNNFSYKLGIQEKWSCILYRSGANYALSVVNDYTIWRLVTSVFLHASFQHLAGNLLSSLFITFYLEQFINNKYKFIVLYLTAGIFGNLLSGTIESEKLGVGASGSIFGLYAFLLLVFIFHHKQMNSQRKQIFIYFLISFIINFVNSFQNHNQTNVGVYAHLGGFIIGGIVGFYYLDLKENHLFLSETWLSRLILAQKIFLGLFILTALGLTYNFFNLKLKHDELKTICANVF